MRISFSSIAVVALALNGCKSSEKGSTADKAAAAPTVDVAAINKLVPADLAAKIKFIAVDKDKVSGVAPEGWTDKFIPGSFRPADEAGLGFMTSIAFGTNCDGACEPKDWAPIVDKVEFADMAKAGTIEKDEKAEGTRLMRVKGDKTYVIYAKWNNKDRRYLYCRATLAAEVAAAADAFEKACLTVAGK